MREKRAISILNLSGLLSEELWASLARRATLVSDDPAMDVQWTHMVVDGSLDLDEIVSLYQPLENDIKLISLTPVKNMQTFMFANGKLIINENWLSSAFGDFILDKFFQEYGGVSLADNYPTFSEKGSFNIANPFNTGEYMDRMVHDAFGEGVNALVVKTFFDHLLMFISGLKSAGKVGLPLEVHYGVFQDVFGVQMNFYSRGMSFEDAAFSLSPTITKRPEQYLLGIAAQACDFLDISVLEDVNKTVVTALWSKDENIKLESRGFLFSQLGAGAAITSYPEKGVTSFQASEATPEDHSHLITLFSKPAEELPESTSISAPLDEEVAKTFLKGAAPEKEAVQTIKGSKEEKEQNQTIKGGKEEKEQSLLIKGSKQEKEQAQTIKGSKQEEDHFKVKISGGEDKSNENESFIVKGDNSENAKSAVAEFARKIKGGDAEAPVGVSENERILSQRITGLNAENENLKSKIKTLMTEVKLVKDSKAQMAEIHEKAKQAAAAAASSIIPAGNKQEEALKEELLRKLLEQKNLGEQDSKRLASLIEKENRIIKEAQENEVKLKKLLIETTQKEAIMSQELEKLNRHVKAKDLIIEKSKESLTKLVTQKDEVIAQANLKLEQMTRALADTKTSSQAAQIRELERQVMNHEKMIEIYKSKMQKPVEKSDADNSKEETRRLQMQNAQMKNQLEMAKKEIQRYQERMQADASAVTLLKTEKAKVEQLLKQTMADAKKTELANNHNQFEMEAKKLATQVEMLEQQVKDSFNRNRDLEAKLQEALRNQKKDVAAEDSNGKGKTAHLEGNIRKLTQDLVESRNQMAEMKKETNKLRQEKTALQNMLDKLKKEADKNKSAAPKKPGMGGKAA